MPNPLIAYVTSVLRREITKIRGSFPEEPSLNVDHRLAVMQLLKALDYSYIRPIHEPEPRSNETGSVWELMAYGSSTALTIFLDKSSERVGVPLTPDTAILAAWADSVLQHAGRIAMCTTLVELQRLGLADVKSDGAKKIVFSLSADLFAIQSLEHDDWAWYAEEQRKRSSSELKSLLSFSPSIRWLLQQHVDVWKEHYIQYSSVPVLDAYFHEAALLHMDGLLGPDTFPRDAVLGGVDFGVYRDAAQAVIGWSLKHHAMLTELLLRHQHLVVRDLTTVRVQPTETYARFLEQALSIGPLSAQVVLDTMTLSARNVEHHGLAAGTGTAPFVEVARQQLVAPVHGAMHNPFQFMLRELRRRHLADWDKCVDGREAAFRSELYALFPGPRYVRPPRNITVRRPDGTVLTDIDAAIFDSSTGLLYLFQLKWQDTLGLTLRERVSRQRNFAETSVDWANKLVSWVGTTGGKPLSSLCGLPPGTIGGAAQVRLVVLGRNTTGVIPRPIDSDVAVWTTWARFVRAVNANAEPTAEIGRVHNALLTTQAGNVPTHTRRREFVFGEDIVVLEGWDWGAR